MVLVLEIVAIPRFSIPKWEWILSKIAIFVASLGDWEVC